MAGHEIDWDLLTSREGEATYTRDGRLIDSVAARELGLTDRAALRLFDERNTLADLWRIAGKLTDGQIVAPPDLEVAR